ncbi:hypothetical protein GOP47_0026302 [Adiantum capillus-veneris]|nr:hypothetical protein GOP47_0026302 [Adiantum capillus-veneris]
MGLGLDRVLSYRHNEVHGFAKGEQEKQMIGECDAVRDSEGVGGLLCCSQGRAIHRSGLHRRL